MKDIIILQVIALGIVGITALIGNTSLFCIVLQKRELRTMLNMYVLNLAAADILASLVGIPVTSLTLISDRWIFGDTACVAFGFITIVSFIASVGSLAMIAINRYVYIVKWQTYHMTFTVLKSCVFAMIIWLAAIVLSLPPLLGWSEYRFIPGKSFCFVHWPSDVYFMYFMIVICFFGPLTVMALSYYKILVFVRNQKRTTPNNCSSTANLRVSAQETRITNTMIIVIICFIGCWAPFAVTMFLDVYFAHPLPRAVDFGSLFLGYVNSMINPILYGLRNSDFRNGFREVFCRCRPCYRTNRIDPA